MRLDMQSMFFDAAAMSGTTLTSQALNVEAAGIAEAEAFVVARFDADAHGATKVELQGSADNATYVVLNAMAVTDTTAGAGVNLRIPQGCPQYLKLVVTGASMKGNVTAGVTLQAPSPRGKRIGDYAANI